MKRSSFLKRLLGVGIMATPAAKLISQVVPEEQKKKATVSVGTPEIVRSGYNNCDPIVITIENTSNEPYRQLGIFNAEKMLQSMAIVNTNLLVIDGIRISVKGNSEDQNYVNALRQSISRPFVTDNIVIISENEKQVWESFNVNNIDAIGRKITTVFFNRGDPYSLDSHVAKYENCNFPVDGRTEIVFTYIYPKTKMEVRIYPLNNIRHPELIVVSPHRGLSGKSMLQQRKY